MTKEFYSVYNENLKTYVSQWNSTHPVMRIVLVHGLGEHIKRYHDQCVYFNEHGIDVIGADLIGHGRSEGKRGYWNGVEDQYKIIDGILNETHSEKIPTILYGHSMGANLCAGYVLSRKPEINGLILTGTAIKTPKDMPQALVNAVLSLPSFLKNITIPSGLNLKSLCSDTEIVKNYKADPLVHDRITLGSGASLLANANKILAGDFGQFKIPTLIMHGADDIICFPDGSKQLTKLFGKNAELHIWPKMLHEIHNEQNKKLVWDKIIEWAKKIK